MQTDSYVASVFGKLASWFDKVGHGTGSYQDYGIVFSGNGNGTTMEFRDHAGKILDYIDIGPLFGALKAAGLDPNVIEALLSSPGGLKYAANLLDADNNFIDAGEIIKDAAKPIKKDAEYEINHQICPDCIPEHLGPEVGAPAYILGPNGKVMDTLRRRTFDSKIDTTPSK